MRVLLLVMLLLPQLAAARVFMCVDQATGKTTFSDKGCATSAAQEEVRVEAPNVFSGSRTAEAPTAKTWVSDRDTRKTGRDYSAAKSGLLQARPTASSTAVAANDGS
jgi:Domain of unknown function (DUF4124)